MTEPHLLVVAKAPVPGRAKTRLGAEVGMAAAARLAAAALADTLAACSATYGPQRCCLALEGTLEDAVDGAALAALVAGWRVFPQRGVGFGARLVHAHADAGALTEGPVIQLGMDTPQVTPELLRTVAAGLDDAEAVLGPADDGGWWVLGARDPRRVTAIAEVPMSTVTTGAETRRALRGAGLRVSTTTVLRDVDTVADAGAVAEEAPGTRFAAAWNELRRLTSGGK